ncbi:class I SAM-dependent methyltransferase [Herbaspirillum frisingense]|uniref:class I SAM-dependent methyltransferase n=1 Tax=Herbaspirillum frisingense TaxID=92645 RepID=UPI0039AF2C3D
MNLIARAINYVLSTIDLAVVRRSTLDNLAARAGASVGSAELQRQVIDAGVQECVRLVSERLDSRQAELSEWHREQIRCQIAQKWSVLDGLRRRTGEFAAQMSCPLCGHEAASSSFAQLRSHCIFGGGDLVRRQCPACDVVFGPDKMLELTEAELSQDYEWHYRVFSEGDSTDQELRAFHLLNPSKDGVYLNYGAGGWSRSVQQLRAEGWNVLAFEPHSSAAAPVDYLIRSHADLQSMRFDGIFSNNVLEHLRHPVREMAQMTALLKEGGRMAHATPCFDYRYEFTRFHLFFYQGRSQQILADKAGLKIDDFIVDGEFMCCVTSRGDAPESSGKANRQTT